MEVDIIQTWNAARGFGHTRKGVFVHVSALCSCLCPRRGEAVPLGTKVFVATESSNRGERATAAQCAECATPVRWELRPTGQTVVDLLTGQTIAEMKPVQVSGKPDSWSCPSELRYRTTDYERAVKRAQVWEHREWGNLSRLIEEFGTPTYSFAEGRVSATWPHGSVTFDAERFVATVRAKPTGRMSLIGDRILAEYDTTALTGDSTWICAARRTDAQDLFWSEFEFVREFALMNSSDGVAKLRAEFEREAQSGGFEREIKSFRRERACLVGVPKTRTRITVSSGCTEDEDSLNGIGDGYYYAWKYFEVYVDASPRQIQWAREMRARYEDAPRVSLGGYPWTSVWDHALTVGTLGEWGDNHPNHTEANPFVPDNAPDPAMLPENARKEALRRAWHGISHRTMPAWIQNEKTIASPEMRDRLRTLWYELFDSLYPPVETDPLYQWFAWNAPAIADDRIHEFAHPSGFVAYGYRDERGETVWLQNKEEVEYHVANRDENERRKLEERLAALAAEAQQATDLAALRAQVAAEEVRAAEAARVQREAEERANRERAAIEEKARFAGVDEVIEACKRAGVERLPERETARSLYLFARGILGTMSARSALALLHSNNEFSHGRARKTRAIAEAFPGIEHSGLDWNRDLGTLETYLDSLVVAPATQPTHTNVSLSDLKAKFGKRR